MHLSAHNSYGVILSFKRCVYAYVCVWWWVLFKIDGVTTKIISLNKNKNKNFSGRCCVRL